jgi:hypothetical protein
MCSHPKPKIIRSIFESPTAKVSEVTVMILMTIKLLLIKGTEPSCTNPVVGNSLDPRPSLLSTQMFFVFFARYGYVCLHDQFQVLSIFMTFRLLRSWTDNPHNQLKLTSTLQQLIPLRSCSQLEHRRSVNIFYRPVTAISAGWKAVQRHRRCESV